MKPELISKKTRIELREFLVGWVLRRIDGVFDAADIECRLDHVATNVGGDRRTRVEQYYASLDFTSARDAAKFTKAFEYVLNDLASDESVGYRGERVDNTDRIEKLVRWIRKDGYDYVEGKVIPTGSSGVVASVRAVAKDFDGPHLSEALKRMEAAVDADPTLAIGQAKELVETCCKSILTKCQVIEAEFEKLDLVPLVKRTAKELALLPEDIPDAAKGAQAIRQVLGSLAVTAQGLAELRNLYGTGHGKEGKRKGVEPRHARLAIGAASTLVTFLFHTYTDRGAKKA